MHRWADKTHSLITVNCRSRQRAQLWHALVCFLPWNSVIISPLIKSLYILMVVIGFHLQIDRSRRSIYSLILLLHTGLSPQYINVLKSCDFLVILVQVCPVFIRWAM